MDRVGAAVQGEISPRGGRCCRPAIPIGTADWQCQPAMPAGNAGIARIARVLYRRPGRVPGLVIPVAFLAGTDATRDAVHRAGAGPTGVRRVSGKGVLGGCGPCHGRRDQRLPASGVRHRTRLQMPIRCRRRSTTPCGWQRCRVHVMRMALAQAGQSGRRVVCRIVSAVGATAVARDAAWAIAWR